MSISNSFPSSIRASARRLRLAALVALLVVLSFAAYAALADSGLLSPIPAVSFTPAPGQPGSEFFVAAVSGLLLSIALWRLVRMLLLVEKGEPFTRNAIAELRTFTLFLLLSAAASILLPMLLGLAKALAAGPGEQRILLTFEGGDFFSLLISGIFFLLARLLSEAQRIAEDASQIV